MTAEFVQRPPLGSVTFQQSVADFLKQAQLSGFTGKIVLHMRDGHVGAVEPQHAPITVDKLTASSGRT